MERCGLDRLEEMKEYLGQEKEQLLMQRMEEAGRRFGDKGCGCKADLEVIIKGLAMGRAEGSVVIASLRSGYITGDGEFYVAYYAGPPFVEEEPDSVCYSMKELLRGVEQDLENMNGKLRQKFIRIMASEQEEIRRWYMDEIYRRMGGVFRKEWGNREKEGQIDIFYGNYMDSVEGVGQV
jgi:hypothetical protein